MKRKTKAKVILHKKLQEGIYDLRLGTDLAQDARAGRFIGIYTSDRSKLLPRPISICEYDRDGNMLDLDIDARDLDDLVRLLQQMK